MNDHEEDDEPGAKGKLSSSASSQQNGTKRPVSSSPMASSADGVLKCKLCSMLRHPIEEGETYAEWICQRASCGLRGDLDPAHKYNQQIMAMRKLGASSSSAAAAASSSSAGRHKTPDTAAHDKMEREYTRLLAEGGVFTEFTKRVSSDADELVEEAFRMQRKSCTDATNYDRPNPLLIKA